MAEIEERDDRGTRRILRARSLKDQTGPERSGRRSASCRRDSRRGCDDEAVTLTDIYRRTRRALSRYRQDVQQSRAELADALSSEDALKPPGSSDLSLAAHAAHPVEAGADHDNVEQRVDQVGHQVAPCRV